MASRLQYYADVCAEFDVWPSLPVTASVLARHPAVIREVSSRGVELVVHGLVHNDHARLSYDEQFDTIARATELFARFGVPCYGFRCPYLRHNRFTRRAVQAVGLTYHSSQAVDLPAGLRPLTQREQVTVDKIHSLYGIVDSSETFVRPSLRDGLVDIPVAMPDDEILVERLQLSDAEQARAWIAMLRFSHARGDLLTLQLHPERIRECAFALRAVLAAARATASGVWVAQMQGIAAWWRRRAAAHLQLERMTSGWRLSLDADADVVLSKWTGHGWQECAERELELRIRPVVGIPTSVGSTLTDALREEGFLAESDNSRDDYAVYIDGTQRTDPTSVVQDLSASGASLVRVARWPRGYSSALCVTGDIDSITLQDFAIRLWEARG